jgi:hypothetical protein
MHENDPAVARLIAAAHVAVRAYHEGDLTFDQVAELDFAATGLEVIIDDESQLLANPAEQPDPATV